MHGRWQKCVAEVSAVWSWTQQHVEWDRFSVGVIMTAQDMLGSDDASPWRLERNSRSLVKEDAFFSISPEQLRSTVAAALFS